MSELDSAVPFSGCLSLWLIDEVDNYRLHFLRQYNPGYKIQSATFHGDHLLVYGSDRLEVLDTDFQLIKTITDPWLAGGHTVYVDQEGFAWVTSAPANAILKINLDSGAVIERIRIPDIYGLGYQLSPQDDLRHHFIPTDLQPTHVNCAYPMDDGLLVTLLIPGAVGYFDKQRNYREIVSGIRGCHGGKLNRDTGEIYLTDSPSGIAWFFDICTGSSKGRFQIESRWLHDVDQIAGQIFAAGLGDKNEIQIFHRSNGEILQCVDCSPYGQSVMFINTCEIGQQWLEVLQHSSWEPQQIEELSDTLLGDEEVVPILNLDLWHPVESSQAQVSTTVHTQQKLQYEYLLVGSEFCLQPGDYVFEGKIVCQKGGLIAGLLDLASNKWLSTLSFDLVNPFRREFLSASESKQLQVVLTACNPHNKGAIFAEVQQISLRQILNSSQEFTNKLDEVVEAEFSSDISVNDVEQDLLANNKLTKRKYSAFIKTLQKRKRDLQAKQEQLEITQEQLQDTQKHLGMIQEQLQNTQGELQGIKSSKLWKFYTLLLKLKKAL
ncbi:hypothetical protein [Allocoleopsis sp.]|uniref:hypothetical protein n=1 Tax=Allocoleopsis sp. TaxID=3088169 RepID=UPI002FD505F8